eukprot:8961432-Alexandrium_andersonii.AAC.1
MANLRARRKFLERRASGRGELEPLRCRERAGALRQPSPNTPEGSRSPLPERAVPRTSDAAGSAPSDE